MLYDLKTRVHRADESNYDEVVEALSYGEEIQQEIEALRIDLETAHRATFD